MTTSEPLRWGIIGTGTISRFVAGDMRLCAEAEIAAVSSRSAEAARAFAHEFGARTAHIGIDALLDDPAVEAVYVGTPTRTHRDVAVRAIQAGKHVLIEKPTAFTVKEAADVFSEAEAAGVFAMEGMWTAFSPGFLRILAEVEAGAIGTVTSIQANQGSPPGEGRGALPSPMLDRGIYPLHLARALLGKAETFVACGTVGDDGIEDDLHATLEYPDDAFAQIGVSRTRFVAPVATISGTGGWIEVPAPFWATRSYTVRAGSLPDALLKPREERFEVPGLGYTPMLAEVARCIRAGLTESPLHSTATSLEILDLAERLRTSVLCDDGG